MIEIEVKNLKGEKVKALKLDAKIFGLEMNDKLVHQIMVAQQANKRKVIAHTKTRAERRGSTAKPWKQKGTGRARTGSVKNPIWRKGGVTFGPRNDRNYSQKINKKMNRKALKMVLSAKIGEKNVIVVDNFKLDEKKTKELARALNNLKVDRKVLVALGKEDKDIKRVAKNIKKVKVINYDSINVLDILSNKFFIISEKGIKYLEKKYQEKINIIKKD